MTALSSLASATALKGTDYLAGVSYGVGGRKFLLSDLATFVGGVTVVGVSSFNARTGAVSLTSGDVTTALGYTPQTAGSYLTANQTITLSGDLSGSGATGIAATIANSAVTLPKMADMATASLIYRKTAGTGAPEVNTLATLKTDLGLTGTNSGDQTITLTGAVTGSGVGSFATALTAASVVAAVAGQALAPSSVAASGNVSGTDLTANGIVYYKQPAPTAKAASATLTIAEILTGIITSTSTTAVSLTLPTGTLTDAGVQAGALATDRGFDWAVINLGSSSGAVTMVAGTGHTIVGSATVAIGTSARFLTRKTAANTFVTYRVA